MQKIYPQQTAGGKGNLGMFIERDPNVCAAGVPTAQQNRSVAGCLQRYSLQDNVDSLIGDTIKPAPEPLKLPPLRRPQPLDMRNSGPFNEASELLRPPIKTKFQTLVEDIKSTIYSSYWKQRVGAVPGLTPCLPPGFDYLKSTLGKKTPYESNLYDVIMPRDPVPDKTPEANEPAYQIDRKYCRPAFDPDLTYGRCSHAYHPGKLMKAALTDDRIPLGIRNQPVNKQQVDFYRTQRAPIGKVLEPCQNIYCVPPDHTFGILKPPDNLPECLNHCKTNPDKEKLLRKCLGHLNTVRQCTMRKRFATPFFKDFYLEIKYFDKSKSGWLPKKVIYDYCNSKKIIFNPSLLEPLLEMLNAFDGEHVHYKTFVDMINHTIPTTDLPKVWDIPDECIDYRTTYSEMVKPNKDLVKSPMAGLPSGRYIDLDYPITPQGCCKADRTYLPEESDAKSCLNPSVLTLLGVSHRDMYAQRSPDIVKKVFERAGEHFSKEEFQTVWNMAKIKHSQGLVSFETFRRALDEFNDARKEKQKKF